MRYTQKIINRISAWIRTERGHDMNDRELARLFDAFFMKAGNWFKQQFQQQMKSRTPELTPAQYRILFIIRRMQPCKMSDLSEEAMVSSSSMTIMLNKMVDDGFVQRLSSKEDRRVIRVKLTPKGDATLNQVHEGYLDQLEQIFATISPERKDRMHALLLEVNAMMGHDREENRN